MASWRIYFYSGVLYLTLHNISSGRNIYIFFFDRVFLVLTQSHCSSFSTKDFGVAVNPLFCPALTGSFPYFSYKEVLDF